MDGLAWSEQRRRGGRSAVPGGHRQALGPAGPRTRRLFPRAGCCGRLGSPRAAACLAQGGPGGPRARHVAGFCPRCGTRLATAPAPAAPSPAEVLAAPPAVLENAICRPLSRSIHLFILSFFVHSFLPRSPRPHFPRVVPRRVSPCPVKLLAGAPTPRRLQGARSAGFLQLSASPQRVS